MALKTRTDGGGAVGEVFETGSNCARNSESNGEKMEFPVMSLFLDAVESLLSSHDLQCESCKLGVKRLNELYINIVN